MPLFFFLIKTGERDQHILSSIYFVEWVDGKMLTSQRSIARGYGVHVNFDYESMKRILSRVTTIWQSSMQKQVAYVHVVFKKYHHMALVELWHIKEELCKGFTNFENKFPKHLNNKERRSYNSNHISNVNYLDKHAFLMIFVHKHQGDKHGIKHMQANHRRHVEQEQHTDSWVWF